MSNDTTGSPGTTQERTPVYYGDRWSYWDCSIEKNVRYPPPQIKTSRRTTSPSKPEQEEQAEHRQHQQKKPLPIWHLVTDSTHDINGELYVEDHQSAEDDDGEYELDFESDTNTAAMSTRRNMRCTGQRWSIGDSNTCDLGSGLFLLTERRDIAYLMNLRQADAATHLNMPSGRLNHIWVHTFQKKRAWPYERLRIIGRERRVLKFNRSQMRRRPPPSKTVTMAKTNDADNDETKTQTQALSAGVVDDDEDLISDIDTRLFALQQEADDLLSPAWVAL